PAWSWRWTNDHQTTVWRGTHSALALETWSTRPARSVASTTRSPGPMTSASRRVTSTGSNRVRSSTASSSSKASQWPRAAWSTPSVGATFSSSSSHWRTRSVVANNSSLVAPTGGAAHSSTRSLLGWARSLLGWARALLGWARALLAWARALLVWARAPSNHSPRRRTVSGW